VCFNDHTQQQSNTLQHSNTATLQHTAPHLKPFERTANLCKAPQHTATHCNTLQHTATHCNTPQHTATHCNTPQGSNTPRGSNTPHHTANYFNTLQTTPTHCTLQHTATHTTTHYNILKHTATLTIGTCVSMAKLKAPGLNTLMLPSVLRDPCVSTNKSIIVENTFYIYIEHVLYKYRTFFLCSRQYFVTPV